MRDGDVTKSVSSKSSATHFLRFAWLFGTFKLLLRLLEVFAVVLMLPFSFTDVRLRWVDAETVAAFERRVVAAVDVVAVGVSSEDSFVVALSTTKPCKTGRPTREDDKEEETEADAVVFC